MEEEEGKEDILLNIDVLLGAMLTHAVHAGIDDAGNDDDDNPDDISKMFVESLQIPITTQRTSQFKSATINVRGVGKDKISMEDIVISNKLDYCSFTEAHLYKPSEIPVIKGYTCWFNIREPKKGGGIIVYAKSTLHALKLQTPKLAGTAKTEQLWLRVQYNKENIFRIGTVYWWDELKGEDNDSFLEEIENQISEADNANEQTYITGDFNCHMAKLFIPITGILDNWNENGQNLYNFIKGAGLEVLNLTCNKGSPWTRTIKYGQTTQKSILDLVLYKGFETRHQLQIDENKIFWPNSDHHLVTWQRSQMSKQDIMSTPKIPKWLVEHKDNDWENFTRELEHTTSEMKEEFNNLSVNEKFESLITRLNDIGETFIKKSNPKEGKITYSKQTPEMVTLLKKRSTARHQIRHHKRTGEYDMVKPKLVEIFETSEQIKKLQDEEFRTSRIELCNKIADKEGKKIELFKYVTRFERQKSQPLGLRKKDGTYASNKEEIDELLDDMWVNRIFKKRKWDSTPEQRKVIANNSEKELKWVAEYLDKEITEEEVDMAIEHIKKNTSHGVSKIPPEFLKNTGKAFRESIRDWMNEAYETGVLPEINEILDIMLLHKKGPTDLLDNYRTLAMGCNLCKLLAKIIGWRIEIVAEYLDILREMQAGFRYGRRVQDNLIILDTLFHLVRRSDAKKAKLIIALMDISKAYDRVDRDILWEKLTTYGYTPKLITFLQASYKNASGIIRFQNMESTLKQLYMGLKQGCVLSPILFAIYIADLTRILEESNLGPLILDQKMPAVFYADDKILIAQEDEFQDLLNIVGEYAHKNKIEFSAKKSMVIPLYRDPDPTKEWDMGYIYGDDGKQERIILKETDHGKYLGVTVKRRKNCYKLHLKQAVNKAKKLVWPITKLLKGLGRANKVAHDLYYIYAIGRITYGLDMAEIDQETINAINVAQNKIARVALGAAKWTKTTILRGELGFSPIEDTIAKQKLGLLPYWYSLPEKSWAGKAFRQQEKWFAVDKNEYDWKNKPQKYWLMGVLKIANELNIDPPLLEWKSEGKKAVWQHTVAEFNKRKHLQVDSKDYMKHYRDKGYPKVDDEMYKFDDTYYWWRMKTGILPQMYDDRFDFWTNPNITQVEREETIKNRICDLCGQKDNIEHALWICQDIKREKEKGNITFIPEEEERRLLEHLPFIKDLEKITVHEIFLINSYLLDREHTISFKKQIGKWIHDTLRVRKKLRDKKLKEDEPAVAPEKEKVKEEEKKEKEEKEEEENKKVEADRLQPKKDGGKIPKALEKKAPERRMTTRSMTKK
jgi:hypothetical protein